jgi:hypothetical protein
MSMVVAFALMVIGIVAFAIGVVANSSAWIFVSIVATATAGVVLFAIHRLDRRRPVPSLGAHAASPGRAPPPPGPPTATAGAPVAPAGDVPAGVVAAGDVAAGDVAATGADADAVPPDEVPAPAAAEAAPGADALVSDVPAPALVASDPAEGRLFAPPAPDPSACPIEGYDDLRVAEILPLLPRLDATQLAVVRGRETTSKRRATILARLDELAIGSSVPDEPGDAAAAPDDFPIPGYGSLRVIDIVPLLRALDPDQLAAVAQREREGTRRQTILSRIDDLLAARVRVDGLRPDN